MTDQTATDQRIEGTREKTVGKARAALGRLTGDRKQQVEGHLTEYKGKARDAEEAPVEGEEETTRLFAMKDGKITLNKEALKGD